MMYMRPQNSPYVEISLDNLLHNVNALRSRLDANVELAAVVKDCAYGCGGNMISKILEDEADVKFFVVARASEALSLRKFGIKSDVLILGTVLDDDVKILSDNNIILTLNDVNDVDKWADKNHNIKFHINIDTGMSRMGILPQDVDALVSKIKSAPKNLICDGVFTHMACADEINTKSVNDQLQKFFAALDNFKSAGINLRHVHYANSATMLRFPITNSTLVRAGIALYGCKPDPGQDFGLDLKPVASLKSSVVKIKKVDKNTPVSYCWNYKTERETHIATIALGYAHGLPRMLSGKGSVIINGKKYRIAGNVTMDYIMVDAGVDPEFKVGDVVTAIGSQGGETITADDVANLCGTIGYEIICNLGTAIPRVYVRDEKIVCCDNGNVF